MIIPNIQRIISKISWIQIKLFFGLSLLGYVVPETTKTCFGVDIEIPNKVRVKPKITRYFVRKVNELSAEAN